MTNIYALAFFLVFFSILVLGFFKFKASIAAQFKEFSDSMFQSSYKDREESLNNTLRLGESISKTLSIVTEGHRKSIDEVINKIDEKLSNMQKDNASQLEKMRETVDEKLQSTLEKRLSEAFKLVSERLELVHKGLGEMQTLAAGVGDLKKVLTNVKIRGTIGEVQLGSILEQIMSSEQYEKNFQIRSNSAERVDFVIKLPGSNEIVYLPIDSKFPIEDYTRSDSEPSKGLENRIKLEAKSISSKYIHPPITTDFSILFLPTEGLYAEVLRIPGFFEFIQKEYRVIITGPWTLAAILNSLQVGFKSLAIEKRTSEVWQVLSTIKREFSKFSTLLEKTHKKLEEASNVIEDAARQTRTIERQFEKMESLPTERIE